MLEHPPVKGKPVDFFVTCIVDMIYPQTGMSAVEVLERLGVTVRFPEAQTCCGQMGFNGGFREESKAVAIHFLKVFQKSEVIVTPSGSCAAMVREYYPQLFEHDPLWREQALRIASITWELTEFIVDGLGITDVKAALRRPRTFALHDSCHGLRGLGIKTQPRALLQNLSNATLSDLPGSEECCGFGGLFAVKMPEISAAMLNHKVSHIEQCPADLIVTCDASCLTQINGGLSRCGSGKRVVHIADVLSGRIED
ncbi:MAG: (Fe-S)-binding protein [Anaerolineae bacterium]|nr:(Fe-S)-binding protein [Anaerolineae bacterium]